MVGLLLKLAETSVRTSTGHMGYLDLMVGLQEALVQMPIQLTGVPGGYPTWMVGLR